MMGTGDDQKELFSYSVDPDKRVRPDNPLRQVRETGEQRIHVSTLDIAPPWGVSRSDRPSLSTADPDLP
jgi:hypothetical protein